MNDYLALKKSNCKNCYKCIRNCPVKSIRFSEHQAHIIPDECVLCGMCFVTCPQNAKQVRNDTDRAKELIAGDKPVYVSLAPSFVANYDGASIDALEAALKKLGFAGVQETAIGATIVKKEYERMCDEAPQSLIISSCCHSVNTLIQKYYPGALAYLAKVMSPMQAHCAKLKKEHDCATVFIGPCISKKAEAEEYPGIVDCVLTFEELSDWLDEAGIVIEELPDTRMRGRARLFPTSGGILRSMDKREDITYMAIDGMENCISALEDITQGKLKNCFIEMSACQGSCIAGPVMKRAGKATVSGFMAVDKSADNIDIEVSFDGELNKKMAQKDTNRTIPGSSAIEDVLRRMGKTSPEQELNCGSCGYNTCREKAIAVLNGKADITMCLPYLIKKAESFSDTIIGNTPNGIIVLNEELEIQQINKAACQILNVRSQREVIGSPIVRITDPSDYFIAIGTGENVYGKEKYLAQYDKYIEETIIYEKEYNILIVIMKDITKLETTKRRKSEQSRQAIEITDKVVEKQMRIVHEIASLLGETTAETKIALNKLKENLSDE